MANLRSDRTGVAEKGRRGKRREIMVIFRVRLVEKWEV
jgi:hypothetical protein